MAEVHVLLSRISTEGAYRLLAGLQDDIASGQDLGPRGAQIQALGFSLEQASQELKREVERMAIRLPTEDLSLNATRAEVVRWRADLMHLADAFARLGAVARSYRF